MVKFSVLIKRKPGMSVEAFRRYWTEQHGPLVLSVPEFMRHIRRYVQCYPRLNDWAEFPGVEPDYDGIAELWADSFDALKAAFSEPRYLELIRPDEAKFADLASCRFLVCDEVEVG